MTKGTALAMTVTLSLVIVVACYSPTEARLAITTDIACPQAGARTGVFVGGDTADATVDGCTAGSGGASNIGSLVIVPKGRGDRDKRITIEVAMSIDKSMVSPEKCRSAAGGLVDKSCIVARRSFAFIEHTSRTLPVKLSTKCLGKTCGNDETCDEGLCISATVGSDETSPMSYGGTLPRSADAGDAGDAAIDAGDAAIDAAKVDAAIDAGPIDACPAGSPLLVAGELSTPDLVGTASAPGAPGRLYWIRSGFGAGEGTIVSVAKLAGATAIAATGPLAKAEKVLAASDPPGCLRATLGAAMKRCDASPPKPSTVATRSPRRSAAAPRVSSTALPTSGSVATSR